MSATGVYLLFSPGKRPCCSDILGFVAASRSVALTHDPSSTLLPGNENEADVSWLELIRDGLTFDLKGLSPGVAFSAPEVRHAFDFPDPALVGAADTMQLVPGPHLVGGERTLPVVRGLLSLVCDLLNYFDDILGVIWPPSQSVIGRRYFESTTSAWLEGGAFPALGLIAFTETLDGALQSKGLSHFIESELRIEPPLSHDKLAATRLGIRLVNQLVLMGGIEEEERVIAPDGTRLVLRQSENLRFIRACTE